MPSDQEFKQLKTQVEMLQGIVDSYQRSFKQFDKLIRDQLVVELTTNDEITRYIQNELDRLKKEAKEEVRKELREHVDLI